MMPKALPDLLHPAGEQPVVAAAAAPGPVVLDTFAGPVRVAWDSEAALSPHGPLVYFIQFLEVSGRWAPFVADCPLAYTSPNAPAVIDVIGTWTLSILAGHRRYAHVTALRGDSVLPELLGMGGVVSEDSLRRGLAAMPEEDGLEWLQKHTDAVTHPLLAERWILDIDVTVKPLYGHQEGAVVGYNPKKPGRPSHTLHTYMIAGLRLVLGVDVLEGNEHTGAHSLPGLWALLERTPRDCWPSLLRGDKGLTSETAMRGAESRDIPFLFKLRLTKGVKTLIERLFARTDWQDAGQGWEGKEAPLRLNGWSRHRRVVVLRRRLKRDVVVENETDGQIQLSFAEIENDTELWEYSVMVTSLTEEILSIAQLYRDRADCENVFDELKNQWGWGGFTTQDLKRCRLSARAVALVYNWWNIFARLAEPDRHCEAITSRPLLAAGIAERVRHGRQTTLRLTSTHGRAGLAERALSRVAGFLKGLVDAAEQLAGGKRWPIILAQAFVAWLKGRQLRAPPRLMAPA